MYTPWEEVVLHDSLSQPQVTTFRAISMETVERSHIIHSLMHRLDDSRCQGLCNIADTQTDHLRFGMRYLISVNFLGDIRKGIYPTVLRNAHLSVPLYILKTLNPKL